MFCEVIVFFSRAYLIKPFFLVVVCQRGGLVDQPWFYFELFNLVCEKGITESTTMSIYTLYTQISQRQLALFTKMECNTMEKGEIFLTKRWRTRQRSTQFHEGSKIDYRRFASEPTPIFFLAEIRTCYCKYWKKYDLRKKRTSTFGVYIFWLPDSKCHFGSHKNGKKNQQTFPQVTPTGRWMEIGSWQQFLKVEAASPRSLRWGWMDGLDMIGSLEDEMLVDGSGSKWLFS